MPRFVSKCPFCDDNTYKYWHHEGCPSDYKEYIDIEGNITCDCGDKWHLVDMKFYCRTHSSWRFLKSRIKLLYLLTSICKINSIDDDFIDTLGENVVKRWKATH